MDDARRARQQAEDLRARRDNESMRRVREQQDERRAAQERLFAERAAAERARQQQIRQMQAARTSFPSTPGFVGQPSPTFADTSYVQSGGSRRRWLPWRLFSPRYRAPRLTTRRRITPARLAGGVLLVFFLLCVIGAVHQGHVSYAVGAVVLLGILYKLRSLVFKAIKVAVVAGLLFFFLRLYLQTHR